MPKNWQIYSKIPDEFLKNNPAYSAVILQLLYNRGLHDPEEIDNFLKEDYAEHDPFLFKDMAIAVQLIITHIKKGNKIMIYGDYDSDGVTASAVVYETLKILKADVGVYLPDRVSEGYGLNLAAIKKTAADGCKLIITVDNGTRNPEEIAAAQALGIDVIVTDHHILPENPDELPLCLLINTANEDDRYPFKYLAGVGVAYKLVEALVSKSNLDEEQKKLIIERNLDLVALGTITDLVKLLGENRLLIKKGLRVLNETKRLGLKELISVAKLDNGQKLDSWNIGFQLGPRLNAASRLEHANTAFELLVTKDATEAKKLAADLNQKNIERQRITEEIMAKVDSQVDKNNIPPVIVGVCDVDEEAWSEGVIGLVAGKISEKYYRPTLVITKIQEGYKGSGRSIEEFNLVEAIETLKDYLDKYGGHPMACGFSIYDKIKLDNFIAGLEKYAAEKLAGLELVPKIKIDMELKLTDINLEFIEQLNLLAPYGQHNPQPRFVSYGAVINDIVKMGADSQHIKIKLGNIWALAFGKSEEYNHLNIGDKIDVVYYLDINNFNGRSDAQMKIIDIKKYE